VQFAIVQFVQLPLDADTVRANVAGLETDHLAETHTSESFEDNGHELSVPSRQ